MRLIDTRTLTFGEFYGADVPRYAILSHTWEEEELNYQDMLNSTDAVKAKAGYTKMARFARKSNEDFGCQWAWIDTCCIDKSSSAELSEAINSMFAWYRKAAVCIAYLSDVDPSPNSVDSRSVQFGQELEESLEEARWFTRGWTLQELLAPRSVVFFTRSWLEIGTKESIMDIARITGIPHRVLRSGLHDDISIAQKMSWASFRVTTRVEDLAYCLMGLFDVNMPLLYGEGDKAFMRLQEEIIRRSEDETIFLWKDPHGTMSSYRGLLARHPSEFADCGTIIQKYNVPTGPLPLHLTNIGINMHLTFLDPEASYHYLRTRGIRYYLNQRLYIPLLHCGDLKQPGTMTSIVLIRSSQAQSYLRVHTNMMLVCPDQFWSHSLTAQNIFIRPRIRVMDVPLSHPITGFHLASTANSIVIHRDTTLGGLSEWNSEMLRPIFLANTSCGVALVTRKAVNPTDDVRVYLVFGIVRTAQKSTDDGVWYKRYDGSKPFPDLKEITSDARRGDDVGMNSGIVLHGNGVAMFQDRLIARGTLAIEEIE